MTFLAIDRKRFEFLLSLGTEEHELRQFFEDTRAALILHGGKVQHLPKGQLARIKTITSELPPKTDADVQSWFSKNLSVIDPIDPEKIVDEFKLYEAVREDLPPDAARRLARSCLFHLFRKPVPNVLIEFLRTSLNGAEAKHPKESKLENDGQPSTPMVVERVPDLPTLFTKLLDGDDVDELAADLPDEIGTYLCGLQAAKQGNFKAAYAASDALKTDSSIRTQLDAFIRREESRASRSRIVPKGPIVQEVQSFEGLNLDDGDQVLSYCTNTSRTTAVFLTPLGVLRSGVLHLLSEADAIRIFPETGSIISFVGTNYPKQPVRGELGIWSVSEHETDKKTRFHLSSEKRTIYIIRPIPFPSSDPDSVRRFLKENHHINHASIQPSLYQLADGLILSARTDRSDLSRDEAFELGLPAYKTLSAFRLEGRLHVIGPLPKESLVFDCGDLGSAVRALFRNRSSIGSVSLSKAQIKELASSLSSAETNLSSQRIKRLEDALHRLEQEQEAFDAAISHIQALPETEARVQEYVQSEASKRLLVKSEVEAEIARLQRDRLDLEGKLAKQREELRKLKDDTTRTVKLAFEKARSEGLVKLLAEVAVFDGLSGASAEALHGDSYGPVVRMRGLRRIELQVKRETDVLSNLRRYGLSKPKAAAFICVANMARTAGLVLGFRGVVARPAMRAWAETLGPDCYAFETSVGVVDDDVLAELFSTTASTRPLVIFDANLSALDLYARPVSDAVVSRLVSESVVTASPVFMVLSNGLGSLPVPSAFQQLMLVLDFDKNYALSAAQGDLADYGLDSFLGLPAVSSLWPMAGRKLFAAFELLNSDERDLAWAILASPR